MKDIDKTREQLMEEIVEMRRQTAEAAVKTKRLEKELGESEAKYRSLIEKAGAGVATIDTKGRFTVVNQALANMTGYSRDEILGRRFDEFLHPDYKKRILKLFGEAASHPRRVLHLEFEVTHKEGHSIWMYSRPTIYWYKNRINGFNAIIYNITERKRAEETLRESERRYKAIFDNQLSMVYVHNEQLVFLEANDTALEWLGYTRDDLGKVSFQDILHPEDITKVLEGFADIWAKGFMEHPVEIRLIPKSGEAIWVETYGIPLERGADHYIGLGIARDITERKQAEEALRESEKRYRDLFESKVDGMVVIGEDLKIRLANHAIADMLGCDSPEELLDINLFDYVPEEDKERILRIMTEDMFRDDLRQANEFRIFKKSGEEIWVDAIGVLSEYDGKVAGVTSVRDITERKQAEEALRESEENFRNSLDTSPLGIRIVTAEGEVLYANQAILDIYGYSSIEELEAVTIRQRYTPESYAEHQERMGKRKLGKPVPSNYEISIVRKDGEVRRLSVFRREVIWGGETQFQALYQDITERKQVEEALRESEEQLKVTLGSIQAGVVIIDEETRTIVDVNPYAAEMFGTSSEKIIGHVCHQFICPAEVGKCPIIDLGQSVDHSERVLVNINGESIPVLKTVGRITLGGRNCLLDSFVDLSDRKEMEEERQRIENLESIGTLAGGIAHDFNNILTGVMGNISLARRHVEPESKAEERLLEAEKASLRAKDLTRQLLTFARGVAPIKKLVSIAELIEDSATFALRGSNVRCEFSFQYDLWPEEVDEGQINQVITNLVLNAGEAMPGGGILDIGIKNRVIQTRSTLPLPEGNYVEITIADHGVGISKEHLRKLFDPYFTTKQKGSGLGLSTAYSIIKNHGGYITVKSRLEVGTTFHIYLPASEKPVPVKKEAATETTVAGKGRILVMDDEKAIRELLHNELTDIGYEVELTVDGSQAIEQYTKARESGQPFDAVILDLTVPGGMGGKEVIEKLLEIDPGVKAIVTSGYSTNPIMSAFREYGFSAAATKPYSVGELERILRSITGNGQ